MSPVVLAVLAMLAEEPLHVYGIQRRIRERAVEMVVNVRNRSGLYAAIERLHRDGLIEVRATERDARRPERTVYGLTATGRQALADSLLTGLATPAPEYPRFPVVVSFLHLVPPAEALDRLDRRAGALEARLAALDEGIADATGRGVARLHLLENEYLRSAAAAELAWVRAVAADLRDGKLRWQVRG